MTTDRDDAELEHALARLTAELVRWPEDRRAQRVDECIGWLYRRRIVLGELSHDAGDPAIEWLVSALRDGLTAAVWSDVPPDVIDHAIKTDAFRDLIAEILAQPPGEQIGAMRAATGQMRRERSQRDAFDTITDETLDRAEKVASMQRRVDEARVSPDETRTRGELEAEGAGRAALSQPMRIQDALRGAEPLKWEMQPGGACTARPRDGITIHVAPSSECGWVWSIDGTAGASCGTANNPAHAVTAAESVYHLTMRP